MMRLTNNNLHTKALMKPLPMNPVGVSHHNAGSDKVGPGVMMDSEFVP